MRPGVGEHILARATEDAKSKTRPPLPPTFNRARDLYQGCDCLYSTVQRSRFPQSTPSGPAGVQRRVTGYHPMIALNWTRLSTDMLGPSLRIRHLGLRTHLNGSSPDPPSTTFPGIRTLLGPDIPGLRTLLGPDTAGFRTRLLVGPRTRCPGGTCPA
eukprot:2741510-Rhodomonas_salina.2